MNFRSPVPTTNTPDSPFEKWIVRLAWIAFAVVILIGAVILRAAYHWPISRQYDLTVRGKVIDEKGSPIPGAVIGSQIEHRCGSLGGGSTTKAFAHFRAKTNLKGEFELLVRGSYWGHVSLLTLSGCTTVEDRFACKPGYNPMLEFNYLHPETMPLTGTYNVTYTLSHGAPDRASGIAFMDLAKDALDCNEEIH